MNRPAFLSFHRAGVILVPSLMAIAACSSPRSDRPATGESHEVSDWTTLFDGTDLDAFRGFGREDVPGSWVIEDGAIAFAPDGEDGGDLMTRSEFGDFELELQWKISPAGNSGIIYRASEEFGAPWMTGPEYQVLDNILHPDARFGPDRMAGANYDVNETDSMAVRTVGEWNDARIVARGNHIEHWLNGAKVVEYELFSEDWNARVAASKWVDFPEYGRRASGHIALQDHGNPVWYRTIRIREL
jgi:3-keto-disaccharide hydrolase